MDKNKLQENLRCENSQFYWIVRPAHRIKIGDRAGSLTKNGYWSITIDGKRYLEHRLVWLWHHGYLPTKLIDHINGDPSDNRIENLREATYAENQQNRGKQKNNTSGYKGVTKKGNRWMAQIRINGEKIYLGTFDTAYEAHLAYEKAALIYHPFNYKETI